MIRTLRNGLARNTWWSRLLIASTYLVSTFFYMMTNRLAALLVKKKPAKGAVRQEIDRTGPKPGNERTT